MKEMRTKVIRMGDAASRNEDFMTRGFWSERTYGPDLNSEIQARTGGIPKDLPIMTAAIPRDGRCNNQDPDFWKMEFMGSSFSGSLR